MDREKLLKGIKIFNVHTMVYFSLNIAKDLFQTEVPPGILNSLRPSPGKERLLKFWINKANIFSRRKREKLIKTFLWRYPISHILQDKSLTDCMVYFNKKIKMEEAESFHKKKLWKPGQRLFRKFLSVLLQNLILQKRS